MTVKTSLLPIATGGASSAWFTVESGSLAKVGLKVADPADLSSALFTLEQQDDALNAQPFTGSGLTGSNTSLLVHGPGTFRVTRGGSSSAVGVFLET